MKSEEDKDHCAMPRGDESASTMGATIYTISLMLQHQTCFLYVEYYTLPIASNTAFIDRISA